MTLPVAIISLPVGFGYQCPRCERYGFADDMTKNQCDNCHQKIELLNMSCSTWTDLSKKYRSDYESGKSLSRTENECIQILNEYRHRCR